MKDKSRRNLFVFYIVNPQRKDKQTEEGHIDIRLTTIQHQKSQHWKDKNDEKRVNEQ